MSKTTEILEKSQRFIEDLEKKNQKLDIIIENAGLSMRCAFEEYPFENHEYMTKVNYEGPVIHTKVVLPHFLKNKRGQIVLINSVSGLLAPGLRSSYAGSKHALKGFFDSLRVELNEQNIQITQIYPGYVQTNISKNALMDKPGQSLGKTDGNIAQGQDVKIFCQEVVKCIYWKIQDKVITQKFIHKLGAKLRYIIPDYIHQSIYKNIKQQIQAFNQSK
ncbi:short-chain dehydrogenase reductase, putative [Ichthyophthirius multifiliis]|uniref:Short-chain dehydrogenase reductase, putative n=1 Tax=Ichthyophthirius multifiliis TaxID=5932 RepID=G0R5Q3_ICHMU|nr:short-chain dehydrogenase reductase, putative [Ichthyophthirius multifiliis]EGR27199.1 short-chain dehydrogenase reductase, putative [Ichthyophthirius multifiliis]|eukprot:XP_004024083.1 short-chain dehydrogenase reductase, putative [Ichthyophthirius multifiliis]